MQRVSDRIILVKLIVGQCVVTFLSLYAPQSGLSDEVKDLFFDQLSAVTASIPGFEFLKDVAIKTNLPLYRILNEQTDM